MNEGIFIGSLIGIITGVVALLLVRTADKISKKEPSKIKLFIAEILTIPVVWFGGDWLSNVIFKLLDHNHVENFIWYYSLGICLTFITIISYPFFRLIVKIGVFAPKLY